MFRRHRANQPLSRCAQYVLKALDRGDEISPEGFGRTRITKAYQELLRRHFISRVQSFVLTVAGKKRLTECEDQLELF